jgi:hypothetical protein
MWLTLNALAGGEFAARERLTDLGLTVYVDTYKRTIRPRHTRKPRTVIYPLLPRYIFWQTEPEQLAEQRALIRARTQKIWPLRVRDQGFLEVPSADIASLQTRQEAGEFDNLQRNETRSIRVGTLVFVISGPLQGHRGQVSAKLRKDTYRVDIGNLAVTVPGESLSTKPEFCSMGDADDPN